MSAVVDLCLILVLAINFVALGVSRIRAIIKFVALQGGVLGVLPLFVHPEIGLRGIVLMGITIALKGFAIPWFLQRAVHASGSEHEDRPAINYTASLLLGAVGTALAMEFSSTLPLAAEHAHMLVVPTSLATVWTGFLILTTRHKAITQVLGYLLLENGIFTFGLLLLEAMPLLAELGVLMDVFTGVFVMVILIRHLNREFASISTEHLSALRD